MERYQVIFTFINFNGDEKEDFLDNNGQGFTIEEAENVSRNLQQGSVVNAKITISNSISIIADPFAFEHVYAMRYVTYLGKKWSILNILKNRGEIC